MQVLNMNITDVKKGQKFNVYSLPIANNGDHAFTGEVVVALMNAKGEIRKIVCTDTFNEFKVGSYYPSYTFYSKSTVDAEPGDYLAIMAKENGSEEYIELYDPSYERMRLPATGYEPLTYEVKTILGEGASYKPAGAGWYNPTYKGKPILGTTHYYHLNIETGIAKYFVDLDGNTVENVKLGEEKANSFFGTKPVYTLEVKTYRSYQEKDTTINLMGAGMLKQALANGNPDYYVYRNIKVNGEIDKRDFDELASHKFKSIDLSGAKIVAYNYFDADMVPKYAFDSNTSLESFKMPAGVKELGFNAFRLTKLKEIDLPETIEEFGRNTFWGCSSLANVYIRHKEAPYWISWCVFANKGDVTRTLHLYPGSKAKYEAYQYTKNWIKYFDNVVEDLEPTGIHSVTLDKETGNKAIYDLNGRRITEAMKKGVYIKNGKKIIAR